ncbi:MAG: hypothetical protein AAF304_05875, partial [Pseudomonadota bacterium]
IIFALILSPLNVSAENELTNRVITLNSNERFDLLQSKSVNFKFQPLSEDARKLEITNDASALGVAYLGQIKLKENFTALSALRSIADQIGESLDINFGVIADSNTSDALKSNELLLLYHPSVTITLALAKPAENSDYEIICTYALKDLSRAQEASQIPSENESANTENISSSDANAENSNIAPVEKIPEN